MNRPDLIALTPDDLAALANRGLVKRAQKECESGDLSAQWLEDDDGTIEARWSDGVTCILPGGKTLKEASCDCPAIELCRHVLRTVLAWQTQQTASDETLPEVWNPARITDGMVEAQTNKATRDRAKLLWNQGILAELLCAVKPSARFHCPGHTVRFPVPDDLRYAQCSCSDPAPCAHAVMAVQAFRLLPPDRLSGIVTEGPLDAPVDRDPFDAATECVRELFSVGLSALSSAWRDRMQRIAALSLPWPAQILEEIARDFDLYASRDAGFSPENMLMRCGELLLRADAILAGCAPVPQAFIRGLKADRDSELGSSRFIGLGANVIEARHSTTVQVFLQEIDNGHTVSVERVFNEPADVQKKLYHQLAQTASVRDASLSSLAAGQLITQGGKRTASGRLVIGRSRAVVNPQNFTWEQLKAPLLVEDFSEIEARLRLLPPNCFRPRRAGSDFHVCPLQAIEAAHFDAGSNSITAHLIDSNGQRALLVHPWTHRGEIGADSLLAELQGDARPFFVAGQVHASAHGLIIHPTALVVAGDGNSRRVILPWIGNTRSHTSTVHSNVAPARTQRAYAPASELLTQLLLQGADRLSKRSWPEWSRIIRELEATGYHRMAEMLHNIQTQNAAPISALKWWRLGIEMLEDENQSS